MILKKFSIPYNKFEIVCAVGKSVEEKRKFTIFAVYIPPSQRVEQTKQLMECLADCIEKVKLELGDPYVIIGGDFNRRVITATDDFPDIQILGSGGTRGGVDLDKVLTNVDGAVVERIEPLATEDCLLYTSDAADE